MNRTTNLLKRKMEKLKIALKRFRVQDKTSSQNLENNLK